MKIEIGYIDVGERLRKDLGDIQSLAASIEENGLIHPIVVARNGEGWDLIAGERRMAACQWLGWTHIDATVVSLDVDARQSLETAENRDRKQLTPSELHEAAKAIGGRLAEAAEARMLSGKASEPSATVAEGRKTATETRDILASLLGIGHTTLSRIRKVMEAAEADQDKYGDIVERMDESGNVAAAVREVKARQRDARIKDQSRKVRAAKKIVHDHRVYRANHFRFVEDGSVDLIWTDPPYGISTRRDISFDDRADMSNDFGEWDHIPQAEFIELMGKWSREFYRVLRDGGSVYTCAGEPYDSYFRAALIRAGFHFKNRLTWFRPNPKPKPDKTSYVTACDVILFAVKGSGHTFNYTKHNEMLSLIKMPSASGLERQKWGHPTQKPVKLVQKHIEVSTNPGDTVLDPFAGSGTTGEACINTGRRFILVEKEARCIEMIEARTGVRHEYAQTVPKVY